MRLMNREREIGKEVESEKVREREETTKERST